MYTSDLNAVNPFLLPAWRWHTAGEILQGISIEAVPEDRALQAAVAFRSRLERRPTTATEFSDTEAITALERAFAIFAEDALARAQLEALVLAGLATDEIAARCRLPVGTVAAYESVFFSVRPYRDAVDWLLQQCVGPSHWMGFGDHQFRAFLAWTALAGGPHMVEALLRVFQAARRSNEPPRLREFFQPAVPLEFQAYVALKTIPAAPSSVEMLADMQIEWAAAQANPDPIAAGVLRNQVQRTAVRCAVAILAGKPMPKVRRADNRNAPTGAATPPVTEATVQGRSDAADAKSAGLEGAEQLRPPQ